MSTEQKTSLFDITKKSIHPSISAEIQTELDIQMQTN
jgi:hypothetical protein